MKIKEAYEQSKKYFPGLKSRLVILKEKCPGPRTKGLIAFVDKKTIKVKSWAKYHSKERIEEILIHELLHVELGKLKTPHNKVFSHRLVGIYKKAFPTSYKRALKTQYWIIKADGVINGKYVPAIDVNGLKMARKYNHI